MIINDRVSVFYVQDTDLSIHTDHPRGEIVLEAEDVLLLSDWFLKHQDDFHAMIVKKALEKAREGVGK